MVWKPFSEGPLWRSEMPVEKGPGCVENEMRLFHKGEMRSGSAKKPVTNPKQAKAIALSVCGESDYAEFLQGLGYSPECSQEVAAMFAEMDWKKQFESGKGPGPQNKMNYEKDEWFDNRPKQLVPKKWQKNNPPQNDDAEMLSPVAYPKQKANWDQPITRQVKGLAQLG